MSDWSAILEEMVTFLNGESFSETVTFSRSYMPKDKVVSMSGFEAHVVPRSQTRERANRNSYFVERVVAIGFQKKVDASDLDTGLDEWLKVVEEAMQLLEDKVYSTTGQRTQTVINDVVYDPARLSENSVFLSVVLVTLQGNE